MRTGSRAAALVVVAAFLAAGRLSWGEPVGEAAARANAAPVKAAPTNAVSPVDLLRAMVEREPTLRYEGVRVSLPDRGRAERRERVYRDGAERIRVEVLDASGEPVRTAVRVGERAWFWSAREPGSWRESFFPVEHWGAWRQLDLLLTNYRVESLGEEEFLKRPVVLLRLASPHADRPSVRLWVDRETCLNVKLEKASPSGERVLGFAFVELSFPEKLDDALFTVPQAGQGAVGVGEGQKPAGGGGEGQGTASVSEGGGKQPAAPSEQARQPWAKRFRDLDGMVRATEAPVVVPQVVPAGFKATDFSLLSRMGVVRIGYSDGLSELSLYESSGREARASRPATSVGEPEGAEAHPRAPGRRPEGAEAERERGPRPPVRGEAGRGGREGGERPPEGGGRQERVWPKEFAEVAWQGVMLRVGRAPGMVVVRRNLTVGTPAVEVQTTVVGEIGEDELKAMSASLSGYQQPVPAEGDRGGAPQGQATEPKQ
jgi:negative regulator of sigma E activity